MRIVELTAHHVRIGLRKPIRPALVERRASDNLVVSCRLADGTVGWGESVPRDYVTGETIDGAIDHLAASSLNATLAEDCASFADVVELARRFSLKDVPGDVCGMRGHAARCAVELSVLDAFGRHFGQPLSQVVGTVPEAAAIASNRARVRYSGAITAESRWKEIVSAWKMRLYGFHQCKLKVAVTGQDDEARLRRLRRILGDGMDLRVDANGGWQPDVAAERITALARFGITSVEQPLAHEHAASLASLRRSVNVPIMLDESLCSRYDAEQAIEHGWCDLFNLRLSKCGGFLRTLDLAVRAHRHGLGYQLGCQVGETGLLSAAGRHFAAAVAGIRYLEGSYDRHLVCDRLTKQDITFGYSGWADALSGPGLGVEVDTSAVERLCRHRVALRIHA